MYVYIDECKKNKTSSFSTNTFAINKFYKMSHSPNLVPYEIEFLKRLKK